MTYRCTGGFAAPGESGPRVISGGTLIADDDPILKTHAQFFEPVESFTSRRDSVPRSVGAVETATAEPGEQRAMTTKRTGRSARDQNEE